MTSDINEVKIQFLLETDVGLNAIHCTLRVRNFLKQQKFVEQEMS